MKITYQAVTDVGRKRKGNEDSLFVNPEQNLFVVADGMGGHAAGEVASKVAVDSINEFVCLTGGDEEITWPFGLDENISYDGNRLKTAIRYANRKVLEATKEKSEYEGMATTVAAVLVDGDTANLGHVGDSRVYLVRRRRAQPAHRATTPGSTSRSRAASSPPTRRAAIPCATWSRAPWAASPTCRSTCRSTRCKPGDILLLCSDGLTTMMPDDEIARVLREADGRRRARPRRPWWPRPTPGAARTTSRSLLLQFEE